MRAYRLRGAWAAGRAVTNCWLTLPGSLATEILAHQGWDSLTIDLQHGQADYAAMRAMLTAISFAIAPVIAGMIEPKPGGKMDSIASKNSARMRDGWADGQCKSSAA